MYTKQTIIYVISCSLVQLMIPRRELQLALVAALVAAMSVQGVANIKQQYEVSRISNWNTRVISELSQDSSERCQTDEKWSQNRKVISIPSYSISDLKKGSFFNFGSAILKHLLDLLALFPIHSTY